MSACTWQAVEAHDRTLIGGAKKKAPRALEADLTAAAGQLGGRALPGIGAGVLVGPAARLGGRNGVQAVRQRVQVGLGRLQRAVWDYGALQQLRACNRHIHNMRSRAQ